MKVQFLGEFLLTQKFYNLIKILVHFHSSYCHAIIVQINYGYNFRTVHCPVALQLSETEIKHLVSSDNVNSNASVDVNGSYYLLLLWSLLAYKDLQWTQTWKLIVKYAWYVLRMQRIAAISLWKIRLKKYGIILYYFIT